MSTPQESEGHPHYDSSYRYYDATYLYDWFTYSYDRPQLPEQIAFDGDKAALVVRHASLYCMELSAGTADQRYYSSQFGRFMTPDPYTNSGRLSDPQSWNRYVYTRGDPINRRDPYGMDDCGAEGEPPCQIHQLPGGCLLDPSGAILCPPGEPGPGPCNAAAYKQGLCDYPDKDAVITGGSGIKYYNIGQDAAKMQVINDRISDLKNRLANDPDCTNWLRQGTSGGVLDFGSLTVTEAQRFELNGNNTPGIAASTRDVPGYDIIVNAQGAFFYGGAIPSASGLFAGISGNTVNGEIFILLHELGHLTGASGIAQNDLDPNVNAANNDDVWMHCQRAILGR